MVLRMTKVTSRCRADDARSGEMKKEVIIFLSPASLTCFFVWNQ